MQQIVEIHADRELLQQKFVNIDTLAGIHRDETQIQTARKIREENLTYVNANSIPARPRESFYAKYGKRILDILLSATALIVLFPLNLVLGICTYFDVGRPIFFRQTRIGKNEKPFTLVKFRNMNNDRDANGDLLLAEQRVTRFGKLMRRTSLDELLNFWSIFKGDMSIIGPRPLPGGYLDRYSNRHKARLAVRPGLECPMFYTLDHVPSWGDRFENDIYYVEHISLALDIKMLWLLVKMVFDRKSRSVRAEGTSGSFMGYEKNGDVINSLMVPTQYVVLVW